MCITDLFFPVPQELNGLHDQKVQVREEELEKRQKQVQARKRALDAKEKEMEQKQKDVEQSRLQVEALRTEVISDKTNLEQAWTDLQKKDDELEARAQILDQLQRDIERREREIPRQQMNSDVLEQMSQLQSQLLALQEAAKDREWELAKQIEERVVAKQQPELALLKERLEEKELELDKVRRARQAEIEESHLAEVAELQEALERTRSLLLDTQDQLQMERESHQQLQRAMSDQVQQWQEQMERDYPGQEISLARPPQTRTEFQLTQRVFGLEKRLKYSEQRCIQLEEELTRAQTRADRLQQELMSEREIVASKLTEVVSESARKLTEVSDAHQAKVAVQEQELARAHARHENELISMKSALSDTHRKATDEMGVLNRAISRLEQEREQLKETLKDAEDDRHRRLKEVKELKARLRTVLDKASELGEVHVKVQQSQGAAAQKIRELTTQLDAYRDRVSVLEKKLEATGAELAKADTRAKDTRNVLAKTRAKLIFEKRDKERAEKEAARKAELLKTNKPHVSWK